MRKRVIVHVIGHLDKIGFNVHYLYLFAEQH